MVQPTLNMTSSRPTVPHGRERCGDERRRKRLDRIVLFNSYEFLFLFFPAALLLHLADRISERARVVAIIAVLFIFYAAWDGTNRAARNLDPGQLRRWKRS